LPGLRVIDEELVEQAHDLLGRTFWAFGKEPRAYDRSERHLRYRLSIEVFDRFSPQPS
jgi:hypothetical protein